MGAQTAERRCGRCQQPFATDPDLTFQSDWGLCPACTEILLPRPAGHHAAAPPKTDHEAGGA